MQLGLIQLRVYYEGTLLPVSNKPAFVRVHGGGPASLYSRSGVLLSRNGETYTDITGLISVYVAGNLEYSVSVRAAPYPNAGFEQEIFSMDGVNPREDTDAQTDSILGNGQDSFPAGGIPLSLTAAQTAAGAAGALSMNAAGEIVKPDGTVATFGTTNAVSYNAATHALEYSQNAVVISSIPLTEFTSISGTKKLYALV